jgi:multiple sugar transport system substrate-binding protein
MRVRKWAGAARTPAVLAGVGALVLALTACGGASSGPKDVPALASSGPLTTWSDSVKKSLGGTEITVSAPSHPSTTALQKMTSEFTKATGVKVKWAVTDENSLKNQQELDYQSGAGRYDVLMMDSFFLRDFSGNHMIEQIDDRLKDTAKTPDVFDYNDIVSAYRTGLGKVNGATYAIPVGTETRFVGYRKDLFAKYNMKPPTTMDELLADAQFFNGKDGMYGIAMRGQKGIQFTSGLMTVMYQFTEGFFDPKTGQPTLTSPQTTQAMQYFLKLLKSAPPDVASYTHEEALSAFMAGKTALWFDATSLAPEILDPSKSTVADKVDFVAPPAGPRGTYGALSGWDLAVAAHSKHKDAAWAFMVWMLSKPNAQHFVALGGAATRTSVVEAPATAQEKVYFPAMKLSLDAAANLVNQGISWIPTVPNSTAKLVDIGNHGSAALAGQIDTPTALGRAEKDMPGLG